MAGMCLAALHRPAGELRVARPSGVVQPRVVSCDPPSRGAPMGSRWHILVKTSPESATFATVGPYQNLADAEAAAAFSRIAFYRIEHRVDQSNLEALA